MPTIVDRNLSSAATEVQPNVIASPKKRMLRSDSAKQSSPMKLKSPRRFMTDSPNSPATRVKTELAEKLTIKTPVRKLSDSFLEKPIWNPTDVNQLSAVKEALHVSTEQPTVVCREDEQKKILEFCKQCVKQEKAGSLYVCGLPGTGKSLSMDKIKGSLIDWTQEEGLQQPEVLALNCTSLTNTADIFTKILTSCQPQKKLRGLTSPLKQLQNSYSQKQQSSGMRMMLIIADELDYLITKDRSVLHDLFLLTTKPFSRCILIGIANAIDLADRFLPKLQSLNCKPMVVTFRAYSKDQIIKIIQQRLRVPPYIVFQPQALEFCARKVASASGDMRKALGICRSAIEILQAEIIETKCDMNFPAIDNGLSDQPTAAACEIPKMHENNVVRIDNMAVALSKAYRSPVVETIQSLPQHQQIILCSAVKLFRKGKKDTTIGELNKSYMDVCKSTQIPPIGIMELSSMCRVLSDQGILKLGQSREEKLRRVALKIDEADITFALQGVRYFRNCLQ